MKRVGVILSGCGVFDGSEIHEAVLTLYFLDRAHAQVHCYAPDKPQRDVVDHKTQQAQQEERNVLTEAARIARGAIAPLSEIDLAGLDAIIFPGGFGAAKNLCSFAVDGPSCDVDPDVLATIRSAVDMGKTVGAICIAPVVVAKALEETSHRATLTIGTDEGTKSALTSMNANPVDASAGEIAVDETNRIVTTPAYMLAQSVSEAAAGIEKLVEKVLEMS